MQSFTIRPHCRLQIANVCLGSPCSQSQQTMEVMNWDSTSCVLHFECWPGRQYVLLKEINCWGSFLKCFLLRSYLYKYSFQLLLTCQCLFFHLACVCLCVCCSRQPYPMAIQAGDKKHNLTFDSNNSQFVRPTSKYIPLACLVLSAFNRHFNTMWTLFSFIISWKG